MEKCGFVMSFEILLSCRMAKKCGFYALLQILLLHMNFMDTINCANATHRVSVKKSWCVQWLLFVGPPELCGVWTAQSWWTSPSPLSNWLSDVVQCKYQDLCTDSYSQANKPIMPTIHIEFELKTLKVCTHEKITRTEGDTLPLHVWHVRYEMKK